MTTTPNPLVRRGLQTTELALLRRVATEAKRLRAVVGMTGEFFPEFAAAVDEWAEFEREKTK